MTVETLNTNRIRTARRQALAAAEALVAAASLFFIAGAAYGLFSDFQPTREHLFATSPTVALVWAPIGAFLLADVMLFRRDARKMFFSGAALALVILVTLTFTAVQIFFVAGLPAWRSVGAEGIAHSYTYTIVAKAPRYDGLFCDGRLSINTGVWFRARVCAPEAVWREATVGGGLTLTGTWRPEGLRYAGMELKP